MKKFLYSFVAFFTLAFLFFFVFKTILVAQTPTISPAASDGVSSQFEQLTDTSDCGELGQQCCDTTKLEIPQAKIISLPAPFDIISSPLNSVVNFFEQNIAKPIVVGLRGFIYKTLEVGNTYCKEGVEPSDLSDPSSCFCITDAIENISRLCSLVGSTEKTSCISCVTTGKGIWTAIGCVQSDLGVFISQKLLGWGVGLAGTIALLCIIYSAFQLQTSRGNPEKIKKAQEMLTSCIMGLMLVIFSVFILRFIGLDILKIPGLR